MKTTKGLNKLLEALEAAPNVKCLIYDTKSKLWLVKYKSKLKEDVLPSEILLDFLHNG